MGRGRQAAGLQANLDAVRWTHKAADLVDPTADILVRTTLRWVRALEADTSREILQNGVRDCGPRRVAA